MRSGPTPGQAYELAKDEISIGRGTTNDIVVHDTEVSRKHARLTLQSGGYLIEDAGSTNGTYVDGQRLIGPHLLRPGETIYLGEKISLEVEAIYDDDATLVPPPTVPAAQPTPTFEEIPEQPQPEPVVPAPPAPTTVIPEPELVEAYSQPEPVPLTQAAPPPPPPIEQPVNREAAAPVQTTSEPVEEEPEPVNWRWMFAGCGCMTVIVFILVVAALFWIDAGGEARWCQYLGFLFPVCP
jgi:hypothetical protein